MQLESRGAADHPSLDGLHDIKSGLYVQHAAYHLLVTCKERIIDRHMQKLILSIRDVDDEMGTEMPSKTQAEYEDDLITNLEAMASILTSTCALLQNFCVQAWQAQKAAGFGCPPVLHCLSSELQQYFADGILSMREPHFRDVLNRITTLKLESFYDAMRGRLETVKDRDMENTDPDDEDGDDEPDFSDYDLLSARSIVKEVLAEDPSFHHLTRLTTALNRLQLQELNKCIFWPVITRFVRSKVEDMASGMLIKSVTSTVEGFANAVIIPFLDFLTCADEAPKGDSRSSWLSQLHTFIHYSIGRMRIADLFDIAASYPDSMHAVHDLQECMKKCDLQRLLIRTFKDSCAARLLIPGAKTNDIITLYVNSIKILRQVDPTGTILEAVSEPIHHYLQNRKDTIRCIMTAMTDDKSESPGDSLFDELNRPAHEDDDHEQRQDDTSAVKDWSLWAPEPVTVDVERPKRARQMSDIIAMLIHVYGSRDMFINEYRGMLAEKLLAKDDFDTDTDLRTLEHLKMRFGENNLHDCEVMMKDVADSKRLYNAIRTHPSVITSQGRRDRQQAAPSIGPVTALIISELFWPTLQPENLALHPEMEAYLEEYAARFWIAKQPCKLSWKRYLGKLDIDLTINGTTKDFRVTPFEATILFHFQENDRWLDSQLAQVMGTTQDILNRKAAFWCKHGVLHASPDRQGNLLYQRSDNLNHVASKPGDVSRSVTTDMEEDASAFISEEDQAQQDMAMFEQYVIAMLTTFDAGLTLNRIHNNLKFFVPDQGYDRSIEELSELLQGLCAEEKLSMSGDIYQRRK